MGKKRQNVLQRDKVAHYGKAPELCATCYTNIINFFHGILIHIL